MTDIAAEFEWYADWAADVSPLYERLARGISESPALVDIGREATAGQPAPQLLLGAVHALLLSGIDHPLATFYPTCTDTVTDSRDEDPFPAFQEFCLAHEDRLREIVASRRVQTNEVGRTAVLLPAFEYVARTNNREPLALIEIGSSAGLNLYWDHYRYEYADYGVYGQVDSPVTIESTVQGNQSPPLQTTLPEVVYRVGNDLEPLDVTDPDDAHWLRALVIPDQQDRHERLTAAIDVVRKDSPELVPGDARDVLSDMIDEAPDDANICVFSTMTLYQFEEDEIRQLRELLLEKSRDRILHWLSGDPFANREHPTYRHVELDDGVVAETQLAEYESYGKWIRWIASR